MDNALSKLRYLCTVHDKITHEGDEGQVLAGFIHLLRNVSGLSMWYQQLMLMWKAHDRLPRTDFAIKLSQEGSVLTELDWNLYCNFKTCCLLLA